MQAISLAYHSVGFVVKDPTRVALKCLCDRDGAGNGSPGIDLYHHLCLSSHLPMFSDRVLGRREKKHYTWARAHKSGWLDMPIVPIATFSIEPFV